MSWRRGAVRRPNRDGGEFGIVVPKGYVQALDDRVRDVATPDEAGDVLAGVARRLRTHGRLLP